MAGYGWRYYKSASWGKKAQDQIPQTEVIRYKKMCSILVDGQGIPLGVCVNGVNRHDMKDDQSNIAKHSHL